jgi:hypothetical protein
MHKPDPPLADTDEGVREVLRDLYQLALGSDDYVLPLSRDRGLLLVKHIEQLEATALRAKG